MFLFHNSPVDSKFSVYADRLILTGFELFKAGFKTLPIVDAPIWHGYYDILGFGTYRLVERHEIKANGV